ncbi:ArdC family protein [uncultured Vagococcus sp.]|uniref:ArdC family protein n=1 Tax=uncultured Vagococcus sp. TaxID=189676 RepID=UPI002588EB53|nr:ArdC family protein [uncultured Vagococcus sp.]
MAKLPRTLKHPVNQLEDDHYFKIEFNERNPEEGIINFENEIITQDILTRLKLMDSQQANREAGYYKFYIEEIKNDEVIKKFRLDIGDGLQANQSIYSQLEEHLNRSVKESEQSEAVLISVDKERQETIQDLIKRKDYKGLTEHLKQGIVQYLETDQFKNYLKFVSTFHQYSANNIQLIMTQNPNARLVAGFQTWKKKERFVKKGAKALYIYAPHIQVKKDKDGKPVVDENGEIQKETKFFLRPVFDVSQTDGEKPLPTLINNIESDLEDPKQFHSVYQSLVKLSPVEVKIQPIEGGANGYYDLTKDEIVLKEGLGQVMTLKVLIHEMVHANRHKGSQATFGDETYRRQEFEAESVAYIVSQHLGMDTSDYSFGYLSSWTKQGAKIDSFSESLKTITEEAQNLIKKVDAILEKNLAIDSPTNKFEERLLEAKEKINEGPREPKKEYGITPSLNNKENNRP